MTQLRASLLVSRLYAEGFSVLTPSTAMFSGAAFRVLTQQTLLTSKIHAYPTERFLVVST